MLICFSFLIFQGNKTEKAEEKKPVVPKVLNIKEEIKAESEVLDLKDLSKEKFKEAKKK